MRPPRRSRWSSMVVIAATYFYFLIFAEFAFLELAREPGATPGNLRLTMLVLAVGGIAGAAWAAATFRPGRAAVMLSWTLRGCAAGGGVALLASSPAGFLVAAVVSGISLGALTVVLASSLRSGAGSTQLGLVIGVGTGVAYALCNIPAVFRASATAQTLLAIAAVLAASLAPRLMIPPGTEAAVLRHAGRREVIRWVAVLLALVWLDSAAFYIIQHAPLLRDQTWGHTGNLLSNATIHLVAAVAAGALLDHGARTAIGAAAVASLALAALMLNGAPAAGVPAHWLYTAGVSLYSVVLVEFPARSARPAVAALVFGVSGWIGSALGIGMAQDLNEIPRWFVAAAVLTTAIALVGWPRWMRAGAVLVAVCNAARGDDLSLGREVYIAEGCIHCHSQYVRPRVGSEVLMWGPATMLTPALAAEPPLFGTRRQGPDLSQVGNRRSPEWNRLHLLDPQAVSPGSRMPSYAHLFARGNERGPALVAYLASLGADSISARLEQIAAWNPSDAEVIAPADSARLFQRLCSQCHGADGRGDGALTPALSVQPPDWSSHFWRRVPPGADVGTALSRIIKFGLPGGPMAGHEYLRDAEIVGLARFVQSLYKTGGVASSGGVRP